MKKNISRTVSIALVAIALAAQSCSDYLDEKLVSGITASAYYNTTAGFEDAVDATYSFLREMHSEERAYMLSVFGTDTHTEGADGNYKGFNAYDNRLNSTVDILQQEWTFAYSGINQANAVVGRADAVEGLAEDIKVRRQAEVRFLRAYYYFYIVQTWGSAHLTLEETLEPETDANYTEEATIYSDAIIPDLEFAIANLPNTTSDYGRATKPAAQFLLGKVLLTRGYKSFAQEDDFSKADEYFTHVISDYNFALVPTHADLWNQDKQVNSEVIWAVQYSTDIILNGGDASTGNRGHLYFGMEYDTQPGMIRDIANGRPFKRFRPTDRMLDVWATERVNDQRYADNYKSVWYCNDNRTSGNGIPLWQQIHVDKGAKKADGSLVTAADIGKRRFELGDTALYLPGPGEDAKWQGDAKLKVRYTVITRNKAYATDASIYSEKLFPVITKFLDPRRPTIQWERGSRDWFLMRHADTYLLRAEARVNLEEIDLAAADINMVRTRAAKPGKVAEMQVTPDMVNLDRILFERALEFDAEQMRWFDLARTNKLVEYVKKWGGSAAQGNIKDFHIHRPIPQAQNDRTLGGYPQNPGY